MTPVSEASKVRDVFLNSIRALAEALEAKDPYTAGHSMRVTEFSVEIALAMNLPKDDVAQIRLAAMLHDVGKIGVRESVLNKEGKLTAEEYDHVMQHPQIGRRILEPIFHGSAVLEIVLHHHERFDGKGRPDGLAGLEAPLGARIIALADAIDAMSSVRPYRPGLTSAEVAQELRKNSGTQFDPEVIAGYFRTNHGEELLRSAREAPVRSASDRSPSAPASAGTPAAAAAEPMVEAPAEPLVTRHEMVEAIRNQMDAKALPPVTAEILQLTSRPNSSVDALTKTILGDASLAAKVLKAANASFYGAKGPVGTIERAVANIGYREIRELVMGIAVVNLFEHKGASAGPDRFGLWRHNLACAALCRAFAARGGAMPVEGAFVAGLLHDLGIAALDGMFPKQYAACHAYARAKGARLVDAERLFMGIDHAAAAAEIAAAWNMEERLRLPMSLHHEPWDRLAGMASETSMIVAAVKLGDILARAAGEGSDCDAMLEEAPPSVIRNLNLDARAFDSIFAALPSELMELESVFLLHEQSGNSALTKPQPPEELAGRKALFIDASDRPVDPVRIFLDSRKMRTFSAESVQSGVALERPDVVVIRTADESAVTANLRELSELSLTGAVGAVKVLLVGKNSPNGNVSSIYPANMTAFVAEPYSTAAVERSLQTLLAK